MAKIVTVYEIKRRGFELVEMSYIRYLKISEALARYGHQVDMATSELRFWLKKSPILMGENLRRVPLPKIRWRDYDVVITSHHRGFDTLETYGGEHHPFIISEVCSTIGPTDMDGIHFYGKKRKQLFSTQKKINQASKFITVMNESAKELWTTCFSRIDGILLIPNGVERCIPSALQDPYSGENKTRCIFAGNVYGKNSQPEANAVIIDKLNRLGTYLSDHGIRLYMLGPGDVRQLDKRHVTYLGVVPYEKTWDYFHFAHVGIVVSAGKSMHNNESSKIYHYLRVGLPVVSEAGFPNDNVVRESKLGLVVENGNLDLMAKKVEEAAYKDWDRDYTISYILKNHTWDKRVEIYNKIIQENF
jgi:glycosyltransferase involved in cell wall biosynthesis